MSAADKGLALRYFDRLFRVGALPNGDGALLETFVADGDDAAFEAIVARHGSMVLGICRRLLDDPHDADDAFQATFLVLVRKARQLRDAERLGPWLYGVATRVAKKARAREIRRRGRLITISVDTPAPLARNGDWLDLRPIFDTELAKLSPKLRDILVLCLLEGFTAEEAALKLSCPIGTAKSRLARGREALRARLTARGLAPAAALAVVVEGAGQTLASSVSQALLLSTVRIAGLTPERISPAVVALSKGVATNMLPKTSILAVTICGGMALAGAGVVGWQRSHANGDGPPAQPVSKARDPAREASIRNMKLIMLAFHNYQSVNGHFPARAIFGADGEPRLSWRVALLPFLGQEILFRSFHLDEPWDSPHNRSLIASMPDVFTTPSSPTGPGTTRIRVFEGPGTLFDGTRGMRIEDVIDGSSNTIAIVAGREAVPWTRPGDLPIAQGKPLPGLDDADGKGVLLAAVDGSIHAMPNDDDPYWWKLITPSGREVLPYPQFRDTSSQTGQPMPVSPAGVTPPVNPPTSATVTLRPTAPAITPELDARLRAIEEKLDLLFQKLESGDKAKPSR